MVRVGGRSVVLVLLLSGSTIAAPLAVEWSASIDASYTPALAPAPGGGVYLGATTGGASDMSLLRYSATGNQLWRIDAGARSRALVLGSDSAGNAYISGQTYGTIDGPLVGTGDLFIRKFDPNGNKLWGRQVGTPMYDQSVGMVVNPAGDAFVLNDPWPTNYQTPAPDLQTELFHFSTNGNQLSRSAIVPGTGTYPGNTSQGSEALVRSSTGDYYAAFSHFYRNPVNVIYTANYLAKANSEGVVQWVKPIGEGSNIVAMDIDSSDNLILAAGMISKFNPDGEQLWSMAPTGAGSIYSVHITDDDRIFLGGRASSGDALVREISGTGNLINQLIVSVPNQTGRLHSLTVSGGRLFGASTVGLSSGTTQNMVMSFGLIPEPTSGLIVLAAFSALRRRR